MAKVSKRELEAQQRMIEMAKEAGYEFCPICSNGSWEIWHEPGNCPKMNVSDKCTEVASKAKLIDGMTPQGQG